jgi:hypothetical protein
MFLFQFGKGTQKIKNSTIYKTRRVSSNLLYCHTKQQLTPEGIYAVNSKQTKLDASELYMK